jgi:hypothetical protein
MLFSVIFVTRNRLPSTIDLAFLQSYNRIRGFEYINFDKECGVKPALLLAVIWIFGLASPGQAGTPAQISEGPAGPGASAAVRAILFWMESCGHCHEIINETLPLLQEQYGSRLEIALVELRTLDEINLLYKVAEAYAIPKNEVKVPVLLIGSRALVGAGQIRAELPGLVESYLAGGGVNFPDLEDLGDVLPGQLAGDDSCAIEKPCDDPPSTEAADPAPEAGPAAPAAVGQVSPASAEMDYETITLAAFAAGSVVTLAGLVFLWMRRAR